MTCNVALVGEHALFLDSLQALIERDPGMKVTSTHSRLRTAREALASADADVIVIDLVIRSIAGLSLARELIESGVRPKLLGVTMPHSRETARAGRQTGMLGFVHVDQPAAEFLAAIRCVAAGECYPTAIAHLASAAQSPVEALTAREREVFDLLVVPMSNEAIGQRLGISTRTVETHRSRILVKLKAHSAAELVRVAAEWGLLDLAANT